MRRLQTIQDRWASLTTLQRLQIIYLVYDRRYGYRIRRFIMMLIGALILRSFLLSWEEFFLAWGVLHVVVWLKYYYHRKSTYERDAGIRSNK